MATRTLDQVLASLGSIYDPQIAQLRQRQELIPGQIVEEEKGLQARQEQAFGDILGGARRRGMGFSGIPLAEQAKYTSTEFLPAIARLRQQGKEQAMSLEDAILGINERRGSLGNQLYQNELSQDLAERQFQESVRQFNAQLAEQAQQRAAAAQSSSASLYGSASQQPKQATSPQVDPLKQRATEAIFNLLGTNNKTLIQNTINAIKKSAGFGNTYDQLKLQIIQQLHPEYLKTGPKQTPKTAPKPQSQSYPGPKQPLLNFNFR
jgi:hypothetical protein